YEIGAPIGAGGMGEVYRARDTRLGRTVAVKILPAEYAQDAKFRIRFEREAKAISALNHPHICTLFDVGDSFLVMEYCEGTTLAARTAAGPLSLPETLEYGMQIADALANAHRRGIVHRDLKPGNIMLTPSGVKLLDFGLAKQEPATGSIESTVERLTEDGRIVGTIQYMAPEVLAGGEASPASDVFALGLVLYEMVTGKPAFGGTSRAGVIAAILEREPVAIGKIAPKTPLALERLIGDCLAKDPSARTLTAEDVCRRLRAMREHPERPRRRKAALAASVVTAAALVAIGGWSAWTRFRAAAAPSIDSLAVLPLVNLSGPEQEYFAAGMHDAMIGQLAQIRALRLISRTSAMHYKDTSKSVPEIARELDVDAIVEGTVLRAGDAVRIQVKLVRARPEERQIWAQTFDRDFKDVLVLQSDVARAIAETIEVRLTPQETTRLASRRPVDPATYDTYLKAMYQVNKLEPENVARGIAALEDTVRKDPRDPFAYAALALAYATGAHGPMPQNEALVRAKVFAETALRLDDASAEAHVAMGMVRAYLEYDWSGAEREFRRAIALNPNLALAHRNF
ncbi:MAG TPA: protein kinase, partial [Thermoanaerobaculia bacterium]